MLSGTEKNTEKHTHSQTCMHTRTHTLQGQNITKSPGVIKKQHRFPLLISFCGRRFQEEICLNAHSGKRRLSRFRGKYNHVAFRP